MKKLLLNLILVLFISTFARAQMTPIYQSDKIDNDVIYFFTKDDCRYCNHAATYISLKYPTLKIEFKDIAKKENIELMINCAEKFQLGKRKLGTPLICMGQNYILGWSPQDEKKFDDYLLNFQK